MAPHPITSWIRKSWPPVALPAPDDGPGWNDQAQTSEGTLRLFASFCTKHFHQEQFLEIFLERTLFLGAELRFCERKQQQPSCGVTPIDSWWQHCAEKSCVVSREECHEADVWILHREGLGCSIKVRPTIMRIIIQIIQAIFSTIWALALWRAQCVPGFMWKKRKCAWKILMRWKGGSLFLTWFPLQVQFALTRSATKWHKHVLYLIYNMTQRPQRPQFL